MTKRVSRQKRWARYLALGLFGALLAITALPALSQTTSTWNGGSGNWSPCPAQGGNAAWDTCSCPPHHDCFPNGNYNAVIPPGNGPVFATAASVVNLSLGSGDTLNVFGTTYVDFTGSSIVNNGSIDITSGNGLFIEAPAVVTLSGTGSISMTDPSARFSGGNGTGATLVNQQTIQGEGGLGVAGLTITNQGTISASISGGTLAVQPVALTNTGVMQAQSGATLDLIGQITYNNSGGTIQALDKSTVLFETNISGGTITTVGTGVLTIGRPGGITLTNLTNAGTFNVTAGGGLTWTGTITNTGVFNMFGSISTSGSVTLKGSGTILMNGGEFDGFNANPLSNQQLIHGSGTFNQVPLTNQSTIQADNTSTPLVIVGSPATNSATLQASGGGTLEIETVINNSGGTIQALDGSTVILGGNFNGTVNGGTLTTAGSGSIQSRNGTLDGTVNVPTNAGTLNVNGFDLFIQGTINNTGAINLTGNSCVILNKPSTLTGSGMLNMVSTTCMFGSGLAFINASTIQGAGTIGDSNPMPIINNGTIIANRPSTMFIVPDASGFTNNGMLIVNPGSTLTINGLLNNLKKGTLSKGTYSVSGILNIQNSIVTNASNITLSGAGAQIFDTVHGVNALAGLTQNKGTLVLQSVGTLTTTTNVTDAGTLTVGPGSSFAAGGSFTKTTNTTTVDGTLSAPSGLTLKKGTIQGQGTLAAAVTSSGTVFAGDSKTKSGVLTVNGAYTQTSTGLLDVAINGTQLGSQYSQLAVSNGISLNGTLTINRAKKFIPAIGTTFTILTGTVITGQFATVKNKSINSGEHFEITYNSNNVTLTVASGP